jgi:hypothetical protein
MAARDRRSEHQMKTQFEAISRFSFVSLDDRRRLCRTCSSLNLAELTAIYGVLLQWMAVKRRLMRTLRPFPGTVVLFQPYDITFLDLSMPVVSGSMLQKRFARMGSPPKSGSRLYLRLDRA